MNRIRFRRIIPFFCLILGLLPVLPVFISQSPILNNDMLVAYFSYFWDFHRNFSWTSLPTFWSSSFQTGMPMHAYWQSGFLYPITWLCFGPLSPHNGIYLFYALHFAWAIYGLTLLGPRLGLTLPASLWAGICFGLSGTLLARYEHPTFLVGWCFIPIIAYAYIRLGQNPDRKSLFLYASLIALQAVGGHPQASFTTALLVAVLFLGTLLSRPSRKALGYLVGGQFLALAYCLPLLVPLFQILGEVERYDGQSWEVSSGEHQENKEATFHSDRETFSFEKFSTGGVRPLHLGSLALPRLLGTPSNASWWGGEVWGEVFLYIGGLGILFCFFASPRRMSKPTRWLLAAGALGLWFAFGSNLGASQILYHIPGFNEFRRPARYLVLFVLAIALLSAHGWQRWIAKPRQLKPILYLGGGVLFAGLVFSSLHAKPRIVVESLGYLSGFMKLDPHKDYAEKISLLLKNIAVDSWILFLAVAGLLFFAWLSRNSQNARKYIPILFLFLSLDLLRLHWDHFYRFPSDFYREPSRTEAFFDLASQDLWRVGHYLEYPGLEFWQMHNGPLSHLNLFEREKLSLSYGIHAIFGFDHYSAHLPFIWKWNENPSLADKSVRYFMSNKILNHPFQMLGRIDSVYVYEIEGWQPRMQLQRAAPFSGLNQNCSEGFTPHSGICLREVRDGHWELQGSFRAGDSLLFRERYHPEWRYRSPGKDWEKPQRTSQDFMVTSFQEAVEVLEWRFIPYSLYRSLAAICFSSLVLFGILGRIRKG